MRGRIKVIILVVIVALALLFVFNLTKSEQDFSSNTILIKQNIPVGGESISNVKIMNNQNAQNFKISFPNVENLIFVEEDSFELNKGESRNIEVHVREGFEQGIYVGQMVIDSEKTSKRIPIIIGVESVNRVFAITQNILPKYETVYPGGKFGVSLKIFNLENSDVDDVTMVYSIKTLEGEEILSDSEVLIVQTSLEKTKIIDIPKTLPEGDYVFITTISDGAARSDVGLLFSVLNKDSQEEFGNLKYFFILVIVFVIGIIAMFVYFIKTRDELLLKLQSQQHEELRNYAISIKQKRETSLKKAKTKKEKKNVVKKFKVIKKNVIQRVKKKHRQQKVIIKRLKKCHKKSEMKSKINAWKSKGFDIESAFGASKKVSKKDIQNLKKQGYRA